MSIIAEGKPYRVDSKAVVMRPDSPAMSQELEEELEDVLMGELGVHWGQRKLAIAVIMFILQYWDPVKHPKITVVYVGAAHGTNIGFMARLFPSIRWELYDPGTFDKSLFSIRSITLHTDKEGFFTNETAEYWAKKRESGENILFISDIRNYPKDRTDHFLRAQYVQNDLESQQEWCKIVRPIAAHLKFPLIRRERDGIEISNRYLKYMAGTIYFQAWNRPKSYETRLVVTEFDKEVYWDLDTAHDQIRYINKYLRAHVDAESVSNEGFVLQSIPKVGLNGSWDAAFESLIWSHYLEKNGLNATKEDIGKLTSALSKVLGMSLADKQIQMRLIARNI